MAEIVLDPPIQRGTVTWDTTDYLKQPALSTPVDASKSILLFDTTVGNSFRPDTCIFYGDLDDNGEGLTFKRGGSAQGQNRAAVSDWQVLSFESGVTVTRFRGTGTLNTPISIGKTVTYSKTWITVSYYFDYTTAVGGSAIDAYETLSAALIKNGSADEATHFQILNNGSNSAANYMHWVVQIVEFDDDSDGSVQHVVTTLSGGDATTVNLPTPVDPSRTMVIGSSYVIDSTGANGENMGLYHDWASNGAEIVLRKKGTATANNVASVCLVTWNAATTVFRYVAGVSFGSSPGTNEESITDIIDWDRAAVFTSGARQNFGQPGNNASGAMSTQFLTTRPGSGTNKVYIQRVGGSYSLNTPICVFQVLAFGETADPTFAWPGDPFAALGMMQDGHWHCPTLAPANEVILNRWTDVKIPDNMARTPAANAIFFAWPSMAFDTKRLETVHYGGGHGNNCWNNELYTFSWITGNWSRLCRPSAMVSYSGTLDYYGSILGEDDAPGSAHTYANTGYMPIADAYITFGGAATQSGSRYQADGGGNAGPYLYDLSKRDPMKVGGADGTGILSGATDTDSEGLYAWHNAYDSDFVASSTKSNDWSYLGAEGSIDVRVEDGKDVIYAARFDKFTKIVINDPYDWSVNTLEDETYEASGSSIQQGAFIHSAQLFFWCLNGTSTELDRFRAWAMNGTKSTRFSITVADPDNVVADLSTGLQEYSYVWDEVRDRVLGCNRYGQIIAINHPGIIPNGSNDSAVTSGWTLELIDVGWDEDYRQMASTESAGRYGLTKYVRVLDALVKVEYNDNAKQPFAWIWKPERDWSPIIDITPTPGEHEHTADNATVTVAALPSDTSPDDCTHGHGAEAASVSQIHIVAANDCVHGHAADGVTVTQIPVVSIADTAHAHSAETASIQIAGVVVASKCAHAHTVDVATVIQAHDIAIADCTHGHSANQADVALGAIPVSPNDSAHAHTADNATILQANATVPDSAAHAHTADNTTVTLQPVAYAADGFHAHTADNVVFVQFHAVAVDDCLHGHVASRVRLPGGGGGPGSGGFARSLVMMGRMMGS